MESIPKIKSRKERIQELLSSGESKTGPAKPITYLTIITVISLIGATIPHIVTYRLFGQTSLFCLTLLFVTAIKYRQQLPGKQIKRSAAIVGITMLLTGCSGMFMPSMTNTTPLIEYLHQADKEYKTGHADGIGIFGFGLNDATVETAMTNGNITRAFAVQEQSAYGWIAVAKVNVYGE